MPGVTIDRWSWGTDELKPALQWLRAGNIVAFPTDTLYGLAVDPTSSSAVEALFAAKGRAAESALPLVAGTAEQVETFCGALGPDAARLASAFWPGPLSIIVDAPLVVDARVHAGQGTVAIRVPDHPVARFLASAFGRPITATSANRSGRPPARSARELDPELAARVFVIDAGPLPGGAPSTIVDVRARPPRLIREGAVPWNRVLESLQA